MKWRHAEEAKRKKEEEDKQDKTQNVSGAVKVEPSSKHRDTTDIDLCLKSDDENDNVDEGEKFEYSFDDDPHHDELVVDEVSSDEDDEQGVHMVRYSSSEEHNKIDSSIYNINKCESDWIKAAIRKKNMGSMTIGWRNEQTEYGKWSCPSLEIYERKTWHHTLTANWYWQRKV